MASLTGIRFKRFGNVHYCDPNGIELAVGDRVAVETDEAGEDLVFGDRAIVDAAARLVTAKR